MEADPLSDAARLAIEGELARQGGWIELADRYLCETLAAVHRRREEFREEDEPLLSLSLGVLAGERALPMAELAQQWLPFYERRMAELALIADRVAEPTPTNRVETMPAREPATEQYTVSFSSQFRKDIGGLDAKLRGRILVAVAEVADNPTATRGDTIKPLQGEEGLFRYRIGDYRLIYRARSAARVVEVVTFASRGSVYA